jgi:HlyD family secretion protein
MVTILRAGFWPRGPGGASTAVFLVLLTFLPVLSACGSRQPAATNSAPTVDVTARAERRPFVHTIRVSGLVAASRSFAVTAPRLAGATMSMLIVTRLVSSGASVRQGDLLVEFDRQAQIKNAFDRRGEYLDLLAQIKKKQADQRTARAADESELSQAENALEKARLELLKKEFQSPIEAEKNQQTFEEAQARLAQLRQTFDLKRRAAAAELRILEIQRDRANSAMLKAEDNSTKMRVLSPLDGLVVPKQVYKGGQMGEVQEGEQVRPGMPMIDVVDASSMEVRARVNQADVPFLRLGQPAEIRLDAYPSKSFKGELVQLAPIGAVSDMTDRVRTFVAVFSVAGRDPVLMPDLSASADVEIDRIADAMVVPRDAVAIRDGKASVFVQNGSGYVERAITVRARSEREVAVATGLDVGTVVRRGGV